MVISPDNYGDKLAKKKLEIYLNKKYKNFSLNIHIIATMSSEVEAASVMSEIYNLNKEIQKLSSQVKLINKRLKGLRQRQNELTEHIKDYCATTGAESVKYKDLIITPKAKPKRKRLTKSQKQAQLLEVLENLGIENSKEACKQVSDAMKGEEIEEISCEIKNL
jgi:cell division protein FtsL